MNILFDQLCMIIMMQVMGWHYPSLLYIVHPIRILVTILFLEILNNLQISWNLSQHSERPSGSLNCIMKFNKTFWYFESDSRRHVASPKCVTKLHNSPAQCWILNRDRLTYSFRQAEFPKHLCRSHGVIWIPDKEFIATTTDYLYKITNIESYWYWNT